MGNVHMEATQINYREGDKKMSVAEAIKNAGNTGLAHTADIAPEFSTESAYNAGDLVYHNGTLYVFTSNHSAGAWSTDDTQAVTVGGEITSLMSGLTNLVVCACDIEKYSTYITVEGVYNVFKPYYVAKIPVVEDTSILVKNAAQNGATYNKFVDINGDLVGSLIQNNNEGTPLTLTVPTGAVALLVTMFVKDGVPHVDIISD